MNHTVKLLKHQWNLLTSKSKYALLIGGLGSGKTWCGSHYILNRVTQHPNALHFIGANTYSQLRDSTLAAMFGVLDDLKIEYTYNQNHGLLEFLGGKVLCKSMDNFNSIRGIEIGSFWLDEVRDLRPEAFEVIMGRLRDKHVRGDLQGRMTSSPAGFNYMFDYFHPSGEKNTPEFKLIHASSYDNPYLPEGYIDSLKDQYSDSLFKQEIMGEFINISAGRVYYAFDRDKNITDLDREHGTVFFGMDFNVDPMTGVLCQIQDGKLVVFDEIFERNSDTIKVAHLLNRKGYKGITIIPDSTGRNRKTSGASDFQILQESGFTIQSTHNPFVMDRVNNVNRLLSNGDIIIHPRCKKLINDLEKVSWKNNQLDQKTDKLLTHISDALGYAAFKLKPIEGKMKHKIHSQAR